MLVVWPHFLAGKKDMYPAARPALGAINKHIHVEQLVVNKPYRLQSRSGSGEVAAGPTNQHRAIADGVLINPGNPLGDGVAAHDGIRYASVIQPGRPANAL